MLNGHGSMLEALEARFQALHPVISLFHTRHVETACVDSSPHSIIGRIAEIALYLRAIAHHDRVGAKVEGSRDFLPWPKRSAAAADIKVGN